MAVVTDLKSYGKFFIKVRIVHTLRSVLLGISSLRPNRDGWEDRMLVVNLESLGDLIAFTGVMKHYKRRFPNKKIFLLIKSGTGLEAIAKNNFADEVVLVDMKKFSRNPFYGAALIRQLRRIGFRKVINQDFSAAEISAKIISVSVGAEEVVGYAGMGLEYRYPFDINQRLGIDFAVHEILSRYTTLIPTQDLLPPSEGHHLPSVLNQYILIYERATGFHENEYASTLPVPAGSTDAYLSSLGVKPKSYVFLSAGSSVPYKEWKIENFAAVVTKIHEAGFNIVMAGVGADVARYRRLEELCDFPMLNLTGKTSFLNYIALIDGSAAVVTNDSSALHVAIAFKKPSLCISGGGHFGSFFNYGYLDRNFWAYEKTACYYDDWRCHENLPWGAMAPCLAAIKLPAVLEKVDALVKVAKQPVLPEIEFSRGGGFET